jgi:hypothetical protein
VQGVNQINPIDVPAARRAGAEVKEVLLPVWLAYLNWGFNFGSVEAFYQLDWENTSIDGCGTYWSVTEAIISASPHGCNSATVITPVVGQNGVPQFGSNPWSQANGLYVPLIHGQEPSNGGQFGIAGIPVDKIDTEFGFYGMNVHSRTPIISVVEAEPDPAWPVQAALTAAGLIGTDAVGPYWALGASHLRNPAPVHAAIVAQATGGAVQVTPGRSFWEYPEDSQIYGISAATNLFGWSVSAEASYQADVPVQINGNDLLQSLLAGIGPNAAEGLQASARGVDAYLKGYDRFDKKQFQINTVKTFSNAWRQNRASR